MEHLEIMKIINTAADAVPDGEESRWIVFFIECLDDGGPGFHDEIVEVRNCLNDIINSGSW